MKYILLITYLLTLFCNAVEITTFKEIKTNSAVTDFVSYDNKIAIATIDGVVEIYDLTTFEKKKQILLPKIKDVVGELYGAKIFSIDYIDNTLLMSTLSSIGYREVYIYKNKKLKKIVTSSKNFFIQETKFVDNSTILIATLSNYIILYDYKKDKYIYKHQIYATRFFDFVMNEDKTVVYVTDENKLIHKIDIKTSKKLDVYKANNTKHLFKLDFKNNTLLAGSKDSKVILFDKNKKYQTHNSDFFVFSVALNKDATKAAYVKTEQGDISIVNTSNFKQLFLLKGGHKSVINKIEFYGKDKVISASDESSIKIWQLSN